MSRPGFVYTCDIARIAPLTGRDNTTARPTYGAPRVIVAGETCAAGQVVADRHEYGTHGQETIQQAIAVHIRHGVDVMQGDRLTLHGSPWDGEYRVFDVRTLSIHQRVLVEATNA